ncbi:MAG: DUF5060 domain-containing protein [Bacteroidota bacterium]
MQPPLFGGVLYLLFTLIYNPSYADKLDKPVLLPPTISGELKTWHKITLDFVGPTSSETDNPNPFADYNLSVTFSKGSESFEVPGYFAGDGDAANTSVSSGNIWRVHFAPNSSGMWNYTVSFTSGTDVAINGGGTSAGFMDGETGSFMVAPTDKSGRDFRGKGRLAYVGEHYLQFQGSGEWFVKAGADAPENKLAYDDFDDVPNRGGRRKSWSPHAQDYDPASASGYTWQNGKGTELLGAIKYLSDKGMNAFSFLTFSLSGDDENVFPHLLKVNINTYNGYGDADQWNQGVHKDRFDISRMDQWEKIFEYADKMGMYLHFKTQETENDQRMDGGDVGRERKLYYRELVARYSHHLALNWNTGEENTQSAAQERDMAAYLAQIDPYSHLIVIHTYPNQKDRYDDLVGSQSEYTGASLQSGINNVHEDIKTWVTNSANSGKKWVVANDEQGGANTGVDNDPDGREQVRREVIWGTFMGAGAGVEFYYGYQTSCTDLDCEDHRSRDQKYTDAAYALKFFQDYFQAYLPNVIHDDGATGDNDDFVLRSTSRSAYAVYRPDGGSTSINLPNGDWTLQWYNPRNGQLQNPSAFAGNLNAPDNNDWVALLTAEGVEPNPNDCNTRIVMNALNNFPTLSIQGFAPAYADATRQALAIDAAQYKDQFAAAQGSFNGPEGTYDITVTTLLETDGESTYRLRINGTQVGEFANIRTATDYVPYTYTFRGVSVPANAQIQMEFNSHSNGLIPEGNAFAFSRGRWTQVAFDCVGGENPVSGPPIVQNPGDQQNVDGQEINLPIVAEDTASCGPLSFMATGLPPALSIDETTGVITGKLQEGGESGDPEAYLETNGLLIIEAESENPVGGWERKTEGGVTFLEATTNHFGNTNGGTIPYEVNFSTTGVYRLQMKSNIEGTNTTESNDTWIKFENTSDVHFVCVQGGISSEMELINNINGVQSNKNLYYPRGNAAGRPDHGNENPGNSGFFKIYRSGGGAFKWDARTIDNNGFPVYLYITNPGTYTMEISERSAGHKVDRIALYKVDTYGTGIPGATLDGPASTKGQGEVKAASEDSPYNVSITVANSCNPSRDTTINFTWYVSDEPLNATCRAKLYLEGIYDPMQGTMSQSLLQEGLVPLSQPFTEAPYAYAGNEAVSSIPSTVSDWVYVEMREVGNVANILAQRAAFLSASGQILELDGTVGISFPGLPSGMYHLAVYHKSHMGVLSAQPISYSANTQEYDFTQSIDQAMGNLQQKPLGTAFGLYAGDYDGSGILNNQDFNRWKQNGATLNQYLSVDADGNGIVNNQDFNLWTQNGSKVGIIEIQK